MGSERALTLWEQGAHGDPLAESVAILASDERSGGEEAVMALPIGERDRRLLGLRRELFGDEMEAVTECPACGQGIELQWSLDGLAPAEAVDRATSVVGVGDDAVEVRSATSADVRYALEMPDAARARTALLERCVINRSPSGRSLSTIDAVRAAVALGELDPLADITVRVACLACDHHWDAFFDIGAFLRTELDAWVHRVSREVHALALAYGWSEASILSMSPRRRALYLDLLSA
jgi:hypothetical protein